MGCDAGAPGPRQVQCISIHAPRVGCDLAVITVAASSSYFNPRTPCGVRRPHKWDEYMKILFQSTHPVWGATWWAFSMPSSIWLFQSTHPVWGATSNQVAGYCRQEISIHAPRVGCDRVPGLGRKDGGISIHAPRVGCDFHNSPKSTSGALISIHAPRVGCDVGATQGMVSDWEFQSTHPVWGATVRFMVRTRSTMISIHAPRVGCDAVLLGHQVLMVLFQSTHPVWGATPGRRR